MVPENCTHKKIVLIKFNNEGVDTNRPRRYGRGYREQKNKRDRKKETKIQINCNLNRLRIVLRGK